MVQISSRKYCGDRVQVCITHWYAQDITQWFQVGMSIVCMGSDTHVTLRGTWVILDQVTPRPVHQHISFISWCHPCTDRLKVSMTARKQLVQVSSSTLGWLLMTLSMQWQMWQWWCQVWCDLGDTWQSVDTMTMSATNVPGDRYYINHCCHLTKYSAQFTAHMGRVMLHFILIYFTILLIG